MFGAKYYLAFGAAFAVVNTGLIYFSFTHQNAAFHAENATLENAQVLFLIISTLGFLVVLPLHHPVKPIHLAISLLCFSFILRELDVEDLDVFQIVKAFGSGQGRVFLLASLWSLLATYIFWTVENKTDYLKIFFSSQLFYVLLIAFLLLSIGAVFDKKVFDISQHRLFEELAETNAYVLISLPILCLAGDWITEKTNTLLFKLLSIVKPSRPMQRK